MRTKTMCECTVEDINERVGRAMERRKEFYKARVQNKLATWNDPSFRLPYEEDLGKLDEWPKGSSPSELIPEHAERARYLEAAMKEDQSMVERRRSISQKNIVKLVEFRGRKKRPKPSVNDVDVPRTPVSARPIVLREHKLRNPVWLERSHQFSQGLSLKQSKSDAQLKKTRAEADRKRRDMAITLQKKQEQASAARAQMVDESLKTTQARMSRKRAKLTGHIAKMKEAKGKLALHRNKFAWSGELRMQTQREAKVAMTTLRHAVEQAFAKYGREHAARRVTDEQKRRMNHNAEAMERAEVIRQLRARQADALNHTASNAKIERAKRRREGIQLPMLQHAMRASQSSPRPLRELKNSDDVVSRRALARSMKLEVPPTPPSPVQCVELALDYTFPPHEVDVLKNLQNYVFEQIAANV